MDGIEGKLKVWIRRVWTLEMVRSYGGNILSVPEKPLLTLAGTQSVIGLR